MFDLAPDMIVERLVFLGRAMSVEEEVECIEYCVENTEEFLKQMISAADILAYYCVTNQCRLLKYHCFSVVN